jgi:hypothetical protein
MTPIPAIPPIDSLMQLAGNGAASASPPAVSPELSAKFQALMQRHEAETASVDGSHGMKAITGVIESQQNEISQMQGSMQEFIEKAPTLDPTERFVASAEIMEKESLVHMKMSLALGATKSSNKSLQSLLKNE